MRFLRGWRGRLLTNTAVLTEVCHLLGHHRLSAVDFLAWAEQALVIDNETARDLPRIRAIMSDYADLPADFAD